jgi:hypothetical protein
VNCQPRSYWIKKFSDRSLACDEKTTAKLSRVRRENNVIEFYDRNALVLRELRRSIAKPIVVRRPDSPDTKPILSGDHSI